MDLPIDLERQLRRLKSGDHVALIYESVEEELAVAAAFVRIGLERQERCAYVVADRTFEEVVGALSAGGIDVARERERKALIALTASAMRGDREICLAAGMDGYLTKPIRAHELAAAIRDLAAGDDRRVEAPAIAAEGARESVLLALGGDEALLEAVLPQLVADSSVQLALLAIAVAGNDAPAVVAAAHAMKGMLATIAADAAAAIAARLEEDARAGRLEGAPADLTLLGESVADLLAKITGPALLASNAA